ncbi:MAG: hypothetical protein IJM36_00425 [Acholeplasmatales bacterium]|nr:hypothetical protein [Acholeplasmatales bacterium]
MMNNVENKNDLNKMSDLEFGKNKVEMMRYRENSLSYKLGMAGIGASVLACFFCLNAFNPINFATLIAIMLNIVILLGGFLCIEKSKSYSFGGSVALIVFGGVCIGRIFWIPVFYLLAHYNPWKSDSAALKVATKALETASKEENAADIDKYTKEVANLTSKVEAHEKFLGKTITSNNYNKLTYLPTDGNVRAILAIVALVVAAAFFIAAGYIGVVRSRKLSTYLNSINQKKVGGN